MQQTDGEATWDVFASCTGDDRDWVRPIVERLERTYRVFLDERSIEHGDGITEAIREAIGSSRVFVAFYSPSFTTRQACQWELLCAYLAARSGGPVTDRIVVVNPVDTPEHIQPIELRDARYVLIRDGVDRLVRAIADRVSRLSTPIGPVPREPTAWWPRRRFGASTFVGRTAELWAMHSATLTGDFPGIAEASRQRIVQIRGLGGVGKSLLAEEYALRFAAAYPGGVFWFDAGGAEFAPGDTAAVLANHHHQLVGVAQMLGLEATAGMTIERLLGALARVLTTARGPYLWVLDDVPDGLPADVMAALMPPGTLGRIVVTTRFRGFDIGPAVDLDVLDEPDAVTLLTRGHPPDSAVDATDARQLARELGHHALALALAGGCIEGLTGIVSFAELRTALAEPDEDAFQRLVDDLTGQVPETNQRNIAAVLWRSLATLDDRGLDVLRIAAALAAAPIPTDLFAPIVVAADGLDEVASRRFVAAGLRQAHLRSLARLDAGPGAKYCQVHPLVNRTVRLYGSGGGRLPKLTSACVTVINAQLAGVADSRDRPANEVLLPHARLLTTTASSGRDRLELMDAVARFDYETGALTSALSMYQRQHEELAADRGEDDLFTLQAAGNIASTLGALGRFSEALELERRVLTGRIVALGDRDPLTLLSANNLALTVRELGNLDEALELQYFIVDIHRKTLGGDHVQTLIAEANLASLFNDLDQDEQALQIQQRVYPALIAALGADHPQALWLAGTMSTSLEGIGRREEAIRLGAEVHRRRKEILGPEHPDTLLTAHNVAGQLGRLGRHEEAFKLQEQILRIRTRVLGAEHPATLATAHNLASTMVSLGRTQAAYELRRALVERFRKVFGADHVKTLTALSNLAFSLREIGELTEAAEVERIAWTGRREALGDYHAHTLASGEHLHMLAGMLGRAEEQAELTAYLSRRPAGGSIEGSAT